MVVTAPGDKSIGLAASYDCQVHITESFYKDGAVFNKWKSLEEGLDVYGREGWLCIMDADVLWPTEVELNLEKGKLYTPRRRMFVDVTQPIPKEEDWIKFPVHPQCREFAGYSQMFHATDPHLGKAPWHETNWRHAGGADSFFQFKWPNHKKIRPKFEVLHLGEAGKNWCGRATSYLDGSLHPDSAQRREQVRRFVRGRTSGKKRFDGEKIL